MASTVKDVAADIDKAMVQLRTTVAALQIRFTDVRKVHDDFARAASNYTVTFVDAEALLHKDKHRKSK